jgi:hypothetical protein
MTAIMLKHTAGLPTWATAESSFLCDGTLFCRASSSFVVGAFLTHAFDVITREDIGIRFEPSGEPYIWLPEGFPEGDGLEIDEARELLNQTQGREAPLKHNKHVNHRALTGTYRLAIEEFLQLLDREDHP